MKKIFILIALSAIFWLPTQAQTSLTVPYGSFEQWTTHSGYNASFFGSDLSVYSDYSTPTGWNYLTYPINESISIYGINVSINTNLPLIKADQATVSVPDGNSAVKLQSFMIEDLVNPTTYALVENNLDTFLTQTVFPSILSNGVVNVNNFLPLLDSLISNLSSPAALFSQLGSLNLNSLITGGMALGSFEPSRLTGSYKYQSATSGDNGAVVLLGTHYNTTTNQRDLVGGGINAVLTDATNYTPFTVYYQSLHDLVPTSPEQSPDSLIILILSSASANVQHGSYLCLDNLALWSDTGSVGGNCPPIVGLAATPDIHEAVLNWSTTDVISGYELEYGLAGFTQGAGTLVSLTSGTYSLTGLAANTAYDVYVHTICPDSSQGDWSTIQFSTNPDTCTSITDIYLQNTADDASFPMMQIAWTSSFSPIQWEVEYGPQGFELGQGTLVTTTQNHFDIYTLEENGNLQPNTWYDFYVRSVCDNSVYGEWDSVQYRTFCAEVVSVTMNEANITVNANNLIEGYRATWTDRTSTNEWYVEYGDADSPEPSLGGATVHETSYALPPLMPNKRYYVSVTAHCGEGNYGPEKRIVFTTQTVGIEETGTLSLSVYPNPASGSCEVSLTSGEPAELKLFTLDGRLLQTLHTTGAPVQLQLPAAGLYLLQATTPSGTTTRKIISK